jgi:hypothetical protein
MWSSTWKICPRYGTGTCPDLDGVLRTVAHHLGSGETGHFQPVSDRRIHTVMTTIVDEGGCRDVWQRVSAGGAP